MTRAPKYVPEDWSTITSALYAWASSATTLPVVWKNQNAPAPTLAYVALGTINPPGPIGRPSPVRARAVRVISATPSTLYRITIDTVNYDYTSGPTTSIAAIIAGLLTALGSIGSAFPFSSDGIVIDVSDAAIVLVSGPLLEKSAVYMIGESEFTLSVDVFSGILGNANPEQAGPHAIRLSRSLDNDPVLEALRVAGLAVVAVDGGRRPLLVRAGAWEDRAGFDVRFRVLTRTGVLLDWIEDAGTIVGTFTGGATP